MKRASQNLDSSSLAEAVNIINSNESLVVKVLAVMKEAYSPFPKELWGLSRATDLLAPRGFAVKDKQTLCRYYLRAGGERRYPVVSLRTYFFNEPICIHTRMSTYRHTQTLPHTRMQAHQHSYDTHRYTRVRAHTSTYARTYTYAHPRMHAYMHALFTHAMTHTCIHTGGVTCTQAHKHDCPAIKKRRAWSGASIPQTNTNALNL